MWFYFNAISSSCSTNQQLQSCKMEGQKDTHQLPSRFESSCKMEGKRPTVKWKDQRCHPDILQNERDQTKSTMAVQSSCKIWGRGGGGRKTESAKKIWEPAEWKDKKTCDLQRSCKMGKIQ